MTVTDLSHFGLEILGKSSDSIVFKGSMAACKRMAFAHGMEVQKYEGRQQTTQDGRAFALPATADKFTWAWFAGGGLLHNCGPESCLLMPLAVWNAA